MGDWNEKIGSFVRNIDACIECNDIKILVPFCMS